MVRLFPLAGIGVDLGCDAIRAVELRPQGNRLLLSRFAEVDAPGRYDSPHEVAGALQELWLRGNFSNRKLVVALPSQQVLVRTVRLPVLPGRNLVKAARYQALEVLPLPLEEMVVDVCGWVYAGTQVEATVVAARKKYVEDYLAVFHQAELQVAAVELSALALHRLLRPGREKVILVEARGDTLTISLFQGGCLRDMRASNVGPWRGAEEEETRLYEVGERLTGEIARALREWQDYSTAGEKADIPLVLGQGSEALASFLESSFSRRVVKPDPQDYVKIRPTVSRQERERLKDYLTAFGLAARPKDAWTGRVKEFVASFKRRRTGLG